MSLLIDGVIKYEGDKEDLLAYVKARKKNIKTNAMGTGCNCLLGCKALK
jgi:hypothetical protein